MKRIYESIIEDHFSSNRQMAFLSGPRQVGKTTTARSETPGAYLNWDDQADRRTILRGGHSILDKFDLTDLDASGSRLVFDEIHKYSNWKQFLKGFFDKYERDFKVLVTGSARLNIYKRGGDSLMGRYFLYRMHPVSVGEIACKVPGIKEIREPVKIHKDEIEHLLEFGGFPEPFLSGNKQFYNKWRRLRNEQFFNEDIRDLTKISDIARVEILSELLKESAGQLINYSSLSNEIQVAVNTVKAWIETLEAMYYCFRIRPFFVNVPKTLRRQPKIYLWDWSHLTDPGARLENFIASHLLKAVHMWTDTGLGEYDLFFLRDKMKREVDFLVSRNKKPWFIVEVKSKANKRISPALEYFKNILQIDHAFQIDFDSPFIEKDCFAAKRPVRVPAETFLSQLV